MNAKNETSAGLSPRVDPLDVRCPRCKEAAGRSCTIVRDPASAKARAEGTVYTNIRRGLHSERIIAAHEERVNRAAAAERNAKIDARLASKRSGFAICPRCAKSIRVEGQHAIGSHHNAAGICPGSFLAY